MDAVLDISAPSSSGNEQSEAYTQSDSRAFRNNERATAQFNSATKLLEAEFLTQDAERRRPSLPQLRTASDSNIPIEPVSSSAASPDLLDMLIPNGNMVPPRSATRLRLGRKRSGSTPNPVKLMRNTSRRYRDMAFGAVRDGDAQYEGEESSTTTTDHGHQTFPETPRAFSPILSAEFPTEDAYPSVANVLNSVSEALEEPLLGTANKTASPLSRASPTPSDLAPIEKDELTSETKNDSHINPERSISDHDSDQAPQSIHSRPKSFPSTLGGSPLVSPIDLPPVPTLSPVTSAPTFNEELFTPAPAGLTHPLPIVETVMAPQRRPAGMRPRLPFGPRRPTQASLGHFASSSSSFSRLGSSSSSINSSPDAKQTVHPFTSTTPLSTPPATTPTFKPTPVRWRGYTYDVAQWLLTSNELQTIVSRAIRQSTNPSNVRLLTLDILDRELPEEISRLETRRVDIETNYKVQVRKRRQLLHYLSCMAQQPVRERMDPFQIAARFAEELNEVDNTCDKLTTDLLDVSDQISQIKRLREVHCTSAFNVALRKLYARFTTQVEENAVLQQEVADLVAARDFAWNQAQALAEDIDRMDPPLDHDSHFSDYDDAHNDTTNITVEQATPRLPSKRSSSSRRSSRVSNLRKNSLRLSKLGLRNSIRSSYGSSMRVNLSTGARSTFSSDVVPPVPPLPTGRTSASSYGITSPRANSEYKINVSLINSYVQLKTA